MLRPSTSKHSLTLPDEHYGPSPHLTSSWLAIGSRCWTRPYSTLPGVWSRSRTSPTFWVCGQGLEAEGPHSTMLSVRSVSKTSLHHFWCVIRILLQETLTQHCLWSPLGLLDPCPSVLQISQHSLSTRGVISTRPILSLKYMDLSLGNDFVRTLVVC